MNPNPDNQLEAQMDRELKSLPRLTAPATLSPRIMAAIAARTTAPWYHRPWPTWPVPLRATALVLLLAAFGGLCAAGSEALTATAGVAAGWFEGISVFWKAAGVLWGAVSLALKSLGPAFLIGMSLLLLLCYAACMGLGTICVRLGYARVERGES